VAFEFRVLGSFGVLEGGREVTIQGAKERAALAILLLNAGEAVLADRLIDDLWQDDPPETARKSLQVRIAGLRKVLGEDRIESRGRTYRLRVEADEFDLERFERLATAGGVDNLEEALGLWRGAPLQEFADQRWAAAPIARLEELRLAVIEQSMELALEDGRHREIAGRLEELVREFPLRERLRGLLMLTLYRCGRQADALEAYRMGRQVLLDTLGIDAHPALRELERAVLRQDPSLEFEAPEPHAPPVLLAVRRAEHLEHMVEIGGSLARRPRRELIVTRPLDRGEHVAGVSASLNQLRSELEIGGTSVRVAAYVSSAFGTDVARFSIEQDADLVVVDATRELLADVDLVELLAAGPSDVVVVSGGVAADGPVLVPFTGSEHDWSAVEIAAGLARSRGLEVFLAGPVEGDRDASRLLASASLAVQRASGVTVVPQLVEQGASDLLRLAGQCGLVVVGLSERWEREGLGPTRSSLVAGCERPVLLVRRGLRPSGLAPPGGHSRFTWSVAGSRSGVEP
jgi:DNA-binding SARP family transcriptional activator